MIAISWCLKSMCVDSDLVLVKLPSMSKMSSLSTDASVNSHSAQVLSISDLKCFFEELFGASSRIPPATSTFSKRENTY